MLESFSVARELPARMLQNISTQSRLLDGTLKHPSEPAFRVRSMSEDLAKNLRGTTTHWKPHEDLAKLEAKTLLGVERK